MRATCAAGLAAVVAIASPSDAATRYDPRLRFRTWPTEHFDIHAHQGEEVLAARLAPIAERVRRRFEASLGVPRGRVQVILVDQTDVANGWATPFPYDTIEVTAVPPLEEDLIGNTTDWLELVFTHEYTHILHLDRSRGFMNGVRHVFGRAPLVFPNQFLPIWQIEGLATYEESRQTGEGRIDAGDFRAIVDTAARQGRFAPIDRANGGLDDWPGGNSAYAYGAYFHQYLSDRFGPARIDALADATAGRLPLFGAGAFHQVFGKSVGTLWRDFAAWRASPAGAQSTTDAAARRLTTDGFVVAAPRVAADGWIYYSTSNADGFPALLRLRNGERDRLAWRVAGDRTSVSGDWVVFDQVALVRSVALLSDLYAVPRNGGAVIQLTHEARAAQPDVSPDGRRIACVALRPGRHILALLDFDPRARDTPPRVLIDDEASDFSGPRWSPDGARLVAGRRHAGGYELVLVNPADGSLQTLVRRADARLITPSWSADGRTILFAADPGDAPFNVFAVDVATRAVRQITDSLSGAQAPEIAPDGSLVYIGYSAGGYDLYSLPPAFLLRSPSDRSADPLPGNSRVREQPEAAEQPAVVPRSYAPLRTLAPTYWEPIAQTDAGETQLGVSTGMSDALGRHTYSAWAAWSAARARPDWSASYAYDRWRPTMFASYGDDTDPVRDGETRMRQVFAGALLPFRHIRWSQTLLAGVNAEHDDTICAEPCHSLTRDLRSLRGGWLFDSRRLFAYSISAEEGAAVEAAIEGSRATGPASGTAAAMVLDARLYQRVLSRHTVLALRLAGASSRGDTVAQRIFSAAGNGPLPAAFDFGNGAIGLLRGFDPDDVIGTHAAVANADLRFPLLRVQRGAGTWPFFVRALHGAAFVDAGTAWDASFSGDRIRRAVGGEISTDTILAYTLRVTLTAGVAWTHDPVAARDRAAYFARLGYAF
ncbi:MAG TPA: hypothetical protein VGI12_02305 [Vicinamibacterales bacterium]